jgi:hypothetical protein
MDQPASQPGRMARVRAVAAEIRVFAEAEAVRSGLPGQDQGPADACRHLVGVAELARRVGPLTAFAAAEWNELESFVSMAGTILDGRSVAISDMPSARRMDRHNNTLAVGLGATSRSTEEVVARARALMDRAIASQGGTGFGNTARWQPSRYWSDGGNLSDWSPTKWPDLPTSEHFQAYRNGVVVRGRPEREGSTGGGAVQVSPHIRDGHAVSGHTRSAPAR